MNVTKIILTRCEIFHLKCTKFNFVWGSAPDHAGGAYSTPTDALDGFGREEKWEEGNEGRTEKREGGERK